MRQSKRILVVDDEEPNRSLLEAMLDSFGYKAELASSGAQALDKLNSNIDLVLLDVLMPRLDGLEVTRRIRNRADCEGVPIVMLTALSGKEDRLKAIAAGANDFISKPIDKTELQVRLASLLKMKDAQEALRHSEQKYRTLVETAKDVIWTVDLDLRYTYVSPSVTDLLGYTVDEIMPMRPLDGFTPASRERVIRGFNEELALEAATPGDKRASRTEEIERYHKDGSTRWTEITMRFLRDLTGKPIGIMGISHDITERKHLEEALRKARDELEQRVEERTAELLRANEQLSQEITVRKKAEEALRESEERYKLLLDSVTDYIYTVRVQDNCPVATVHGLGSTTVTGYTAEDYLLDSDLWYRMVYEPDRPAVKELAASILAEKKVSPLEHRIVHRDGTIRWVRNTSVPCYDQQRHLIAYDGLIEDITERKQAEQAVEQANREWERTFNAISDLVMVLDDQHKILRANKAMADAVGMTEQELIGKPCFELVHGALEPPAFCPHSQLLADGQKHSAEVVEPRLGGIYDVRVSPLVGQNGQVIGSVHITHDITERKRAEEELKESERRYRTLFEESMDGVYSDLRDGTITDANRSVCELFGYSREEMIGKDIRELYLDPADRPKFQKEIEKKGFVKDYEIKFQKRDGTEVDCLISSSLHFEEDESIAGYRGILRDLTARKALQRQLQQAQKMEAVGTLAGGIAHDFNNILQVVLGYSELLLADEDLPKRRRDDLEKIFLAGKTGADLVQRLLTFSRKTETKLLDLDLNQRIRQTHKFLQRTIPKMIDIELMLIEDLGVIHADPTQMDQVLMNLAVNARDAMPEGGKLIIETSNVVLDEDYARSHVEAKPGEYVLLGVSDTGSGMDKETLEHIFEPFYTTKAPGQGTGLGLAMVFGIVKQHHGFINCYSEVGRGTTFNIYLPAVVSEAQSDQPVVTAMPQGGTETVLLVDDEEFVRDLGKRILERSGYTVLTASNGEEALDLYNKGRDKISLVILDLIMPEMGGKQCLEKLLKIDPKVRVLIASGFAASGQTNEAIEAGARGFIGKPFNMKGMLQSIREGLDGA